MEIYSIFPYSIQLKVLHSLIYIRKSSWWFCMFSPLITNCGHFILTDTLYQTVSKAYYKFDLLPSTVELHKDQIERAWKHGSDTINNSSLWTNCQIYFY